MCVLGAVMDLLLVLKEPDTAVQLQYFCIPSPAKCRSKINVLTVFEVREVLHSRFSDCCFSVGLSFFFCF